MFKRLKRLSEEDRVRKDMEYSVLCCQQRTLPHLVLEDGSHIPMEQVNLLLKSNIKNFNDKWEYIEKMSYYRNLYKLSFSIGIIFLIISIVLSVICFL